MRATEDYIRIMTAALSTTSGIRIEEAKDWSTDVETKVIKYDIDDLRNLPFNITRGLILHEMGHVLFTEVFHPDKVGMAYIDKYGIKTMQSIFNAFEDMRIEQRMNNKYGRFSESALKDVNYYSILKRFNQVDGNFRKYPKWTQFVFQCFLKYAAQYDDDVYNLVGGVDLNQILYPPYAIASGIEFDEEVNDLMVKNQRDVNNYIYQIQNARSGADGERIVCDKIMPLIEKLLDQDPEAKPQPQKGKGKKQQQQGSGKSQPQQGQGQPQSGQGNNQEGDDKEEQNSGGQDEKDGKNEDDNLLKCVVDSAKDNKEAGEIVDGGSIPGKYGSKIKGLFAKRNITHPTEAEAKSLLKPYSNVLANRLRDILAEKATTRWTGSHKSGKLLGKNAFKVSVADESRIFSKRNNPDTPKYSIYIALDGSGSMGSGGRATHAFMGSSLLKDVCRILNFDLRIYEYGYGSRELKNLDDYRYTAGNTNDYEPLNAIDKVINPQQENIIFFITDGEPDYGAHRQFETLWAKMKREKNATLFGVGIGGGLREESMRNNYEIGVSVPRVEELPMELIRIMRNVIHR